MGGFRDTGSAQGTIESSSGSGRSRGTSPSPLSQPVCAKRSSSRPRIWGGWDEGQRDKQGLSAGLSGPPSWHNTGGEDGNWRRWAASWHLGAERTVRGALESFCCREPPRGEPSLPPPVTCCPSTRDARLQGSGQVLEAHAHPQPTRRVLPSPAPLHPGLALPLQAESGPWEGAEAPGTACRFHAHPSSPRGCRAPRHWWGLVALGSGDGAGEQCRQTLGPPCPAPCGPVCSRGTASLLSDLASSSITRDFAAAHGACPRVCLRRRRNQTIGGCTPLRSPRFPFSLPGPQGSPLRAEPPEYTYFLTYFI